jgi:hypothetical protein
MLREAKGKITLSTPIIHQHYQLIYNQTMKQHQTDN